jgi:hypothetical protein
VWPAAAERLKPRGVRVTIQPPRHSVSDGNRHRPLFREPFTPVPIPSQCWIDVVQGREVERHDAARLQLERSGGPKGPLERPFPGCTGSPNKRKSVSPVGAAKMLLSTRTARTVRGQGSSPPGADGRAPAARGARRLALEGALAIGKGGVAVPLDQQAGRTCGDGGQDGGEGAVSFTLHSIAPACAAGRRGRFRQITPGPTRTSWINRSSRALQLRAYSTRTGNSCHLSPARRTARTYVAGGRDPVARATGTTVTWLRKLASPRADALDTAFESLTSTSYGPGSEPVGRNNVSNTCPRGSCRRGRLAVCDSPRMIAYGRRSSCAWISVSTGPLPFVSIHPPLPAAMASMAAAAHARIRRRPASASWMARPSR